MNEPQQQCRCRPFRVAVIPKEIRGEDGMRKLHWTTNRKRVRSLIRLKARYGGMTLWWALLLSCDACAFVYENFEKSRGRSYVRTSSQHMEQSVFMGPRLE